MVDRRGRRGGDRRAGGGAGGAPGRGGGDALFAEPPDAGELEELGTIGAASAAAAPADTAADTAASGSDAAEAGEIVGRNVSSFDAGDIFGLLWRLALVGGIIYASIFLLRKFVNRSSRIRSDSGALQVLETIGLGSNRLVSLVEAGDLILVVGSAPNQVTLLAELSDPEVVAGLRGSADQSSPGVATLGEMMRKFGQSAVQRVVTRDVTSDVTGDAASQPAERLDVRALTPILERLMETQAAIAKQSERLQAQGDTAATPARSEAE